MQWLGGATVLTLGADLLAACDTASGPAADAAPLDAPNTAPDLRSGDWSFPDGGFGFAPGADKGGVLDGWAERTVDTQDLIKILSSWKLTVDGMVETPLTITFADLALLPRQDQITDFHCVEGWSVLDVPWSGVHISRLFDPVKVQPGATHVTFHTIGGTYNESLPLQQALEPRTMLGYGVGGATLPLKHGFPLRVVIPRLLGYKNAKYVQRLELTDHPIDGYWVAAGYPYAGDVPPARLRPGKY